MNWDNIYKMLEKYTQYKHYQVLFENIGLQKRASREDMLKELHQEVAQGDLFGTLMPPEKLEEWLALHQIDGNNHTFVYHLEYHLTPRIIQELYSTRNELTELKLWDVDPDNDSEELPEVMPELDDIKLTGIHRNDEKRTHTFSFVAPCIITGSREDGASRLYKKMFFAHCVFLDGSKDFKVIFNPTSNLHNVNGVRKEKKHDWSPIANMIFEKVKTYIGNVQIKSPIWIPQALYEFAEDATNHKNEEINSEAFKAEKKIEGFSEKLLKEANIDTDKEPALLTRLIQDIQLSFEAQLLEVHGSNDNEEEFSVFQQRSDGLTHVISVESTQEGLVGSAAQAAKRSRQDGDIDMLGVNYKSNGRMYKFLVESGIDAYLIRGTNTFIEEEVVTIVVSRLNKYRGQIQAKTEYYSGNGEDASFIEAE
ncbi:hypothetical protein [Halobacillus seohaensis]|uniref:Uncharacterized protein n=1 Tax=Halobacillus seohaensis TaxID=447421 RepID=A0ABW2ENR2_9BACI